jgi:hypothetical protein
MEDSSAAPPIHWPLAWILYECSMAMGCCFSSVHWFELRINIGFSNPVSAIDPRC